MTVPLFASPAHNELVCALVVARLVAARRLAPRGHRMTAAGGLAFTAAVWMVNRVHGHTAVYGTLAQPDIAARLADGNILVVHVTDLADRRHAINQDLAGLARRQLDQCVLAFFCDELCGAAGRTHHLRALARLELNVVHRRAGGDVLERQCIAHQDVGIRSADDLLPYLQPHWLKDVAL